MLTKTLKRIFCVLSILSYTLSTTTAQDIERPNGMSASVLFIDNYSLFDGEALASEENKLTNGLEIAYNRYVSKYLVFKIPVKLGLIKLPSDRNNKTFGSVDGTLQLRYFKPNNTFVPYLFSGLGGAYLQDEGVDFQVPVGAGLDIKVGPHGYINLQGEFRKSINMEDQLQYGVGYRFWIGAKDLEKPKDLVDSVIVADLDKDGILDSLDLCPDVPGLIGFKGCPDTDKDGVQDSEDECPEIAGNPENNGCPSTDQDNDGFNDGIDECPNIAGTINGCPDGDKDGISDKYDKCPNLAGTSESGCPVIQDTDGDGIPDSQDACPYAQGIGINMGCPDSDSDGVADNRDKCPLVSGPASNQGCPSITYQDQQTLKYAVQNINFKTGSNQLTTSSYTLLDDVADILKRNPSYRLEISGYTDNVGKSQNNLNLSRKRAKACYDYLVVVGIPESDMSYYGYGEDKPIASNDSSSGRRKNRRVEFDLKFK